MQISARNRLEGTYLSIYCKVKIEVARPSTITAMIIKEAVEMNSQI
ncbi:hypothetical protein C5S29_14050 [ANME-1 cluster archaeon GoMg3.2]|nr:hypothetical protein [ANME-1 cluster archaeon GoMg3.2]